MDELFDILSSNTQLLEGISPEEFGEQFKDENSLGELFDIVNEGSPNLLSGINRDSFISEYTPKQDTNVDNMSEERQAYLGLSDFKSVDDYILAAAQQQEAQQIEDDQNVLDFSDAANIFTWDFLSNNYKAGIIQGKIGNLHEIGINTITDDPTTLDPDFFGKSAALYRHQQEISQKLEEGRSGERNAGRFLSDVVGGIISSPVAAVREMVSDLDGVAPLLLSLIPGMQSVGVQTAFGLAGADVEAGAIMTDKIQEYASEKGIDLNTEEGWREVYKDTEFIAQAKKDAAMGGAIVGVAEGASGFAAGKVGRAASKITSMKQVGYNFGGRLAVGAAFDGSGEALKQLYLDGEIDGWETAVEALSGPAQSTAMIFFETKADRRAITDNRIADDILENERNGSIRPRDEGGSNTSIADDVNTTPEEEQAALAAADAQNQAQEAQGVTEAVTPSAPTTPVTPPTPPEKITAGEVEAVKQAGQRKREALNTIPDQAIEDHLDGSPQNTVKLVQELAKRGGIKSERKDVYVELSQDISAAIKKLPENLRNAQTDTDKAKARDVVQSMLNRQSLQGKLHRAEQAAKNTEEGINKKELKKVASIKKELDALNKHIVDIVNDDTFTLADYDATTFMLREVQNETEDNLRPDRSKVEVRGNKVEVSDPTIHAGVQKAVDKLNQNNANVDGFIPFELAPLEVQQEAPLAIQEGTFTIDITSPQSTVESDIGDFTVDVEPRVARITPSESFSTAPVEQQENTLFQAGKELEAQRKRLVADDLSILSEDTIAAWDNLVAKGEATFTKKGGYRMRTDTEARKVAEKKIREKGIKAKATKEVADVRKRKLDEKQAARQLKSVTRGVMSNANKKPIVKILSDNDFRALAPTENKNDIAYVEDLETDSPIIYINSTKQRASTLPHEMAHVLIADKLGTVEQRKDIVVKLAETLKGVLATSPLASEQALLDQLRAFVDRYEGDPDVLAEEFLSELSAFLVVNESRLTPRKQITQRILRAINRAISSLIGVPNVLENVDDVNEAIEFINGLADELSGNKNVDQVVVSPVTRKKRTKKTVKVEGDKAVLVPVAPGTKQNRETFTVGKTNIYYTNREVAGNQTNDVEMSPITMPKGVRKKAQAISALNTFIEKMDNAGIPIVVTPSLQSEQRFYSNFGFTLSEDGKTMSRGVGGSSYTLPENQAFAEFSEDTPTPEELIEEINTPAPTPTATTKRTPQEGETFLYDGGVYTARNVKGGKFDGVGDNGSGIKGATIQDSEFEGVNVVVEQEVDTNTQPTKKSNRSQIDDSVATDAFGKNLDQLNTVETLKVRDNILTNIAKRINTTKDKLLNQIGFKFVPQRVMAQGETNVREFIQRGMDSRLMTDYTDTETSPLLYQLGAVQKKYTKNNGVAEGDYVLSHVLDISDVKGFSFLGHTTPLNKINTPEGIREEINARLEDIHTRAKDGDDFYIQEFSDRFLENGRNQAEQANDMIGYDTYQAMIDGNNDLIDRQIGHLQDQQRTALLNTLDYLIPSQDYTPEFKYLMVSQILRGRTEGNPKAKRNTKTVGNHQKLSPSVLPDIYRDLNNGDKTDPFTLYEKYANKGYLTPEQRKEIVTPRVVEERPTGYWVHFPESRDNADITALTALSNEARRVMGDDCWCTGGGMSATYLPKGDFYLFVNKDFLPQVTIRYENGRIVENKGTDRGQLVTEEQAKESAYFFSKYPGGKDYESSTKTTKVYFDLKNGREVSLEDMEEAVKGELETYDSDKKGEFITLSEEYIQKNLGPIVSDNRLGTLEVNGREAIAVENSMGFPVMLEIYSQIILTNIYEMPKEAFNYLKESKDINSSNIRRLSRPDLAISMQNNKLGEIWENEIFFSGIKKQFKERIDNKINLIKENYFPKHLPFTKQELIRSIKKRKDNTSPYPAQEKYYDFYVLGKRGTVYAGEVEEVFNLPEDAVIASSDRYVDYDTDVMIYDLNSRLLEHIIQEKVLLLNKENKSNLKDVERSYRYILNKEDFNVFNYIEYIEGWQFNTSTATDAQWDLLFNIEDRIAREGGIIPPTHPATNSERSNYREGVEEVITLKYGDRIRGAVLREKTREEAILNRIHQNKLRALQTFNFTHVLGDLELDTNPENPITLNIGYLEGDVILGEGVNPENFTINIEGGNLDLFGDNPNVNIKKKNTPQTSPEVETINLDEDELTRLEEQYLPKNLRSRMLFQREEFIKGAYASDLKTLLFTEKADITTVLHEMAHLYEDTLTEEEIVTVEKWSGHKRGTTEFSEAFAKGAELYVYEGSTLLSKMDEIFKSITNIFRSLIEESYFEDVNSLDDSVREIYYNMIKDNPQPEAVPPTPTPNRTTAQTPVRRQLDDDIKNDEQDFIDEVLGSRFYSVEEKEALLREYGITDVTVKDTTFTANRTSPQTPVRTTPQQQQATSSVPGTDAANNANLTEEEIAEGTFTIHGQKVSFDKIEAVAKRIGAAFKRPSERQSFITQYAIAYARGYVDPPGRVGLNTSKIIDHVANGGSVDEYQIMSLRQAYHELEDKIERLDGSIEEIKSSPTKNLLVNRSQIEAERNQALMDIEIYQDTLLKIGSSTGRSLRLYGEFKSQEFNAAVEVRKWMKEDAALIDEKQKASIEKDVAEYEAVRKKLKDAQKERDQASAKAHYQVAVKSIREILAIDTPSSNPIVDDFRDMFRKTKRSNRSQVDDNNNLSFEQQAFKYTEIYKGAKRVIRAEKLTTVEEVANRVIEIFEAIPEKDTEFFAQYGEPMTIDTEDVRIALELGMSSNVTKRKTEITNTLTTIKRLARASQSILDVENAMVAGDVNARTEFATQLHNYINSLLAEGLGQAVLPDNLSASMMLLSSVLNKYDAALVGRGVADPDMLAAARDAMRKGIQALGVNLQADKVDTQKLEEAWQAKLIAENAGNISNAALSAQAPVGDGLTPSEREANRVAIRRAQRAFVAATRKLNNHREAVERRRTLNDPSIPTWEKFKVRTEGLSAFMFEATRQVVFSFDLSFIGIQAGMNLMGMIPATAVDAAILAGKGRNPMEAVANLRDFGMNAKMAFLHAADKGKVEDMYLDLLSSRVGAEAVSIQPDFFSDPRKGADGSQREELVRAAFGQKLAQWAEDNQTAYGKFASVAKGVGSTFSYFSDNYTMFMNYVRMQQYQSFLTLNPNATNEQKRIVLQNVMDNTGKGVSENALESAVIGQGMSSLISAPRLYLSYWKKIKNFGKAMVRLGWTTLGQSNLINIQDTTTEDTKLQGLDFAAIELLKQYTASAIGVIMIGGALAMFGWEFEDDKKDRSYLKFKKEDKIIDISAGMAQYVRVAAWMHYDFVKSDSQAEADRRFGEQTATQKLSLAQRTVKSDLTNLAWYKLHPTIRSGLTAITGKDAVQQTLGVTDSKVNANILMTHLPITMQAVGDAFGVGRTRLDNDDDWDYAEASTFLGVGSINKNNALGDIRVEKYMNNLEWKDGKEVKVGYAPTRLITAREAKKYMVGEGGNFEDIVDSNRKQDLLKGFRDHAQHFLGQWLLEELAKGETPSKKEIATQAKIISASVAKEYHDAYILGGEFEFTQE